MAIVALVVVAGLIPATAASASAAPRVRYYEGTTSEGGRLSISVVVKDGVPYLSAVDRWAVQRVRTGPRATSPMTAVGWFPAISRDPFPRTSPSSSRRTGATSRSWCPGASAALRGSGTLTVLIPALTADEQAAQVCTFGGTWSVERTDTSFSLKPTMTVEAAGGRTLATGFGVAGSQDSTTLARTETGPIRHYQGGTTQDTAWRCGRAGPTRASPCST